MNDKIQKFKVHINEQELVSLKHRLMSTRWPDAETVEDWSQGIPLEYMKKISEYWANDYDWRATEDRLNEFAQFRTEVDNVGIHFLHIPSPQENAQPLILTHGWPGSIIEFLKVIEPLSDPVKFGGSSEQAFHIVCPSLPGFGFSDKPTGIGWTVEKIADAWIILMSRLGYESYFAQGGDWGSAITTAIAFQDPEHCRGIHLNMPGIIPDPDTLENLTEYEQAALADRQKYEDQESGYAKQQSTRPQTLAYGLVDSPIGQAAWVLEKFFAWTDNKSNPETLFNRDELLDNVMMYWLSGSGGSSARLYWESYGKTNRNPLHIPVGCSIFPKEIFRSSKRWAKKRFKKLVYWNQLEKGGHFAAFEQPEVFVQELRACFSKMDN